MVKTSKLKTGLTLLEVPKKEAKTTTIMLMVKAGSRFENPSINGLSHFLEHMFFKGTKNRPTAFDISKVVDGIGGEINAATGKDHTLYYIKTTPDHITTAFDLLSDMLTKSQFKIQEIEKEKGVIIEEINMYEDMPIRKIGDNFETLLYGNTPIGWPIIGTKKNILNTKRNNFTSYISSRYITQNMVLAVSGATNDQNIKKLADKYFNNLSKNSSKKDIFKKIPSQKSPQLDIQYKKTDQAHLILGVPSYNLFHKDRYVLSVLSAILGGGMSSRLFIEVREKRGLAYYVRSSTELYQDVGSFQTQAGVDLKRIDLAIKVIKNEYLKIKDNIKKEELERAKNFLKGHLLLALEDTHNLASFYATTLLLENTIKTPEQVVKKIDKVTLSDIKRVADEIFTPASLNLSVIGPYKNKDKFQSLLKSNL